MKNIYNTIENAIISLLTGVLVFIAVTWSNQRIIDNLTDELGKKVTYSINNEFTKLKSKDGSAINLNLTNEQKTDSAASNREKRKRWFNFSK
ncbi:MAG: hypothetical protein EHM12_08085 [Dehalococcoidia bacterium]|nr:MAG: hypothetical protein EHM12_08085 [Dehalococcoidia bacterium]